MRSSGESSSQRNERLRAEEAAKQAKIRANQEQEEQQIQENALMKKSAEYNKRKLNMGGGSREGLMYRGNQAGVQ